jgi:membrane protease YdiL (CAAX protease family)
MTDEEPQNIAPDAPAAEQIWDPGFLPPPPAPAEPSPFWTYVDLLLIAFMTVPCMALGILVVRGVVWLLHQHPKLVVVELLPAQILGYVMIFTAIAVMFQAQYGQPFWRSLGWVPSGVPFAGIAISGVATAVGVAIAASLLKTPETSNPMTEMLQDRTSLLLLTFFGVAIAPVAEELAFRGFLQPLLVRSMGPVYGILGAAIPFGLLHFHEYGNSWRHAVVISLAGAGFGIMRQRTGSTRAAAAMHAAYNAFLFLALFASRKDLPHLW